MQEEENLLLPASPDEGKDGTPTFAAIKNDNSYMALRYDKEQHWYYVPDMQEEENLLIKTFDSEHPDHAPCHGAFDDMQTIQTALPRRSVETRCVLIFPSTSPASKL